MNEAYDPTGNPTGAQPRNPHPYGGSLLSPSPLGAMFQRLNPRKRKTGGAFGGSGGGPAKGSRRKGRKRG